MRLPFTKLHGAGNDYILVDATANPERLERAPALVARLSDRHFGVGSDGLIVIGTSDAATMRMHMWNADGSRGAVCGNGLRCMAWLAHDLGLTADAAFTIESDETIHSVVLRFESDAVVGARIGIGTPHIHGTVAVRALDMTWDAIYGTVGKFHATVFVDRDPAEFDLDTIGTAFQHSPRFGDGVNLELVEVLGADRVRQRTFERGSGETLACGSGATFAVAAAMHTGRVNGPTVAVELPGGELKIERDADGSFSLEGPVACVFTGEVEV